MGALLALPRDVAAFTLVPCPAPIVACTVRVARGIGRFG